MATKTDTKLEQSNIVALTDEELQELGWDENESEEEVATEKPETRITVQTVGGSQLDSKSVILVLSFGRPGVKKKVGKVTMQNEVKVEADHEMLHLTKDIIDSDRYKDIVSGDSEARKYVYSRSTPSTSILGRGMYRLPLDFIEEVENQLTAMSLLRQERIAGFLDEYDELVEEARTRLGKLFNLNDYPSKIDLAGSFKFSWNYLTFGLPEEQLKAISDDLFKDQENKLQDAFEAEEEEVTDALRTEFKEYIDRVVVRLGYSTAKTEDGGTYQKPMKFHDTLVTGLEDWIRLFPSRNMADDLELSAQVDRARRQINKVNGDPQVLRDDDGTRRRYRKVFELIQAALDGSIQEKTSKERSIMTS